MGISRGFSFEINEQDLRWNYESCWVLARFGHIADTIFERDLASVVGLEVSHVRRDEKRDFFAAFNIEPIVDITLVRGLAGDTSIVTYSLDRGFSEKTLSSISSAVGLVTTPVPSSFIQDMQNTLDIAETRTYEICRIFSSATGKKFEKVFGSLRYINFLLEYKKMPYSEARKEVLKAYGFNLPEQR